MANDWSHIGYKLHAALQAMDAATAAIQESLHWLANSGGFDAPFWPRVMAQNDPAWSDAPLGTSPDSTIGRYGCLITSIAYLLNAVVREDRYTPIEINRGLIQHAGYINGNRVAFRSVEDIFKTVRFVGLVPTPAPLSDQQFAEIDRRLAQGVPVIVKVDISAAVGIQEHYVAIADKRSDGYWIADPWRGNGELIPLLTHYPQPGVSHDAAHAIEAIVFYDRRDNA